MWQDRQTTGQTNDLLEEHKGCTVVQVSAVPHSVIGSL